MFFAVQNVGGRVHTPPGWPWVLVWPVRKNPAPHRASAWADRPLLCALCGASSRKANKRLIACEIIRNRRNFKKTNHGANF